MSLNKALVEPHDCVARVTTQEKDFLKYYSSVFKGINYALVREGENEHQHYHMYIKGLRYETLVSRLKKYFKGNDQYSCKKVTNPELQLRYIFKGTEFAKPVVIHNGLEVDVEEQYKLFWTDRQVYNEIKKDKKKSLEDFKMRLYKKVIENLENKSEEQIYSIKNIVTHAMAMCREEVKLPPSDHLMFSYIEFVRNMGNQNEDCVSLKIERMENRMLNLRKYGC